MVENVGGDFLGFESLGEIIWEKVAGDFIGRRFEWIGDMIGGKERMKLISTVEISIGI
jgi:hypothetical protein